MLLHSYVECMRICMYMVASLIVFFDFIASQATVCRAFYLHHSIFIHPLTDENIVTLAFVRGLASRSRTKCRLKGLPHPPAIFLFLIYTAKNSKAWRSWSLHFSRFTPSLGPYSVTERLLNPTARIYIGGVFTIHLTSSSLSLMLHNFHPSMNGLEPLDTRLQLIDNYIYFWTFVVYTSIFAALVLSYSRLNIDIFPLVLRDISIIIIC